MKNPVPVVMYHTVGIRDRRWQCSYLTCPYGAFENHLKWLKLRGFHTITLQQLYDHMAKGACLPSNPVVLTFDDGYADNWIYAYPILKKYGFTATVYVNPEFVDPGKTPRKNLCDVFEGTAGLADLETLGYLSWPELEIMSSEGVMDVESHSMTHTWYPTGPKIIDFRSPGDPYTWMTWNDNVEKKPFLQTDDESMACLGEPVYEHGRAIGGFRYFPDEGLKESVAGHVERNGGRGFFNSPGWRDELSGICRDYKDRNTLTERYETADEYERRVYFELGKSREIIEKKLDKEVKFLCWPGGATTKKALEIASDTGYLSSTAGRDMGNTRRLLRNVRGEDPSRINRTGICLYWDGIEGKNSRIRYFNGFELVLSLHRFRNPKFMSFPGRAILGASYLFHKYFGGSIR